MKSERKRQIFAYHAIIAVKKKYVHMQQLSIFQRSFFWCSSRAPIQLMSSDFQNYFQFLPWIWYVPWANIHVEKDFELYNILSCPLTPGSPESICKITYWEGFLVSFIRSRCMQGIQAVTRNCSKNRLAGFMLNLQTRWTEFGTFLEKIGFFLRFWKPFLPFMCDAYVYLDRLQTAALH